MKLSVYDNVELNTELEELAEKGIHKNDIGTIFEIKGDKCFVRFINRKNIGDYACVSVKSVCLDVWEKANKDKFAQWEEYKKTDRIKKNAFKPQKFLEYDLVELTVEKEKYAKFGVHKGMQGVVMEDYCIDSEYYVIFTDKNTAEDIADLCVNDDDLVLVWRNPDKIKR